MKIWETELPKGYGREAMYLRKWLLDLRAKVKASPLRRENMLRAAISEYCPDIGRKQFGPGSKAGNIDLLVKSVAE